MTSRRIIIVFTTIVSVALTVFAPALVVAQIQDYVISYDEGLVRFEYDQYPWGSIEGTYSAEGPVWNDDLTFPNGALSGSGGVMEVNATSDTNNVIAMSAIINDNGTIDAAVVFVAFSGVPAPGSFEVELGGMEAGFVWLDDASNLTFPEDNDFEAWFNSIEAAGKYVGMVGTIVVSQVDAEKFVGTFSGRMVNPGNFVMVDIIDGVFDITNYFVAEATPEISLATMDAQPNPFNPQTVISLNMPNSGQVNIQVYDMRGRMVRQLASGSFSEGNHSWVWDGKSDDGMRLAGGLYVAKAAGQGWHVTQKLVYVP